MVTILVIAATVVISFMGFRSPTLTKQYYFNSIDVIERNQWYRVVTSGFLHADLRHLLFNMFGLWIFASDIELAAGPGRMLLIYFVAIVGGSLLSLALYRHREYRSLGASGGVYGILLAHIFFFPGQTLYFFGLVPLPSWLVVIGFILMSIRGIENQSGNIGHAAHLGGAAAGLVVATILYPQIIAASPWLYMIVMGLCVGSTVYFSRKSPSPRRAPVPRRASPPPVELETPPEDVELSKDVLAVLIDKAEREGVDSLTERERILLERLLQQ